MNEIRTEIIRKIIHQPGIRFNEIWDKIIPSNKLAYHMKVLEEDNFIEKREDGYYLTHEGKKHAALIDGKSGKNQKKPLTCVAIVLVKDNEVLMTQRRREPFFGVWGFPSGKMEFNQYILEAAKDELVEETGLEAILSIRGLFCSKTFNNNEQSYNHQIFIVRGDNPIGELLVETREARNEWISINKINEINVFPEVPYLINASLKERFSLIEMDRHQENDEFKKIDNLKETEF